MSREREKSEREIQGFLGRREMVRVESRVSPGFLVGSSRIQKRALKRIRRGFSGLSEAFLRALEKCLSEKSEYDAQADKLSHLPVADVTNCFVKVQIS